MKTKTVLFFILAIIAIASLLLISDNEHAEESSPIIVETKESSVNALPSESTMAKDSRIQKVDCMSFQISEPVSSEWKLKTRKFVKQHINGLVEQNVDEFKIDAISISSGIGLQNGRNLRNWRNGLAPFIEHDAEIAPLNLEIRVQNAIKEENNEVLYELLSKGKLTNNLYFANNGEPKSLLGLVLELNNEELVEELLDRGLNVEYSDLAKMTKNSLPLSFVRKVHRFSGLNPDKVLKGYSGYTSLVLLAIEAHSFDLAKYWTELGSPLQPDPFGKNALNLLLENEKYFESDSFSYLYELIKSNSADLLKEIPDDESSENLAMSRALYLESGYDKGFLEKADIDAEINFLFSGVLSEVSVNGLDSNYGDECFSVLGEFYIKKAFEYKRENKVVSKKLIDKQDYESLIALAKSSFDSEHEIEQFLGEDRTLSSKNAIEYYRKKRVKEISDHFSKGELDTDESKQLMEDIAKVYMLASLGKWKEANEILNQIEFSNQSEVYSMLVHIAIVQNADFSIIDKYIKKGGKLYPNAITVLIQHDNADLAKMLLKHDLDLSFIDPMGYSALTLAVQHDAYKMLKFLFEAGLRPDINTLGYDALDIALIRLSKNRNMVQFVTLLLLNGYNVESSHIELVVNLKLNNFERYIELISSNSIFVADA